MGRFSKVVFGRAKLPARCIVYGGAYLAERKEVVRSVFGEWTRLKGTWIRYVYARSAGKEFLVVFNVYGGAVALEVLQIGRASCRGRVGVQEGVGVATDK